MLKIIRVPCMLCFRNTVKLLQAFLPIKQGLTEMFIYRELSKLETSALWCEVGVSRLILLRLSAARQILINYRIEELLRCRIFFASPVLGLRNLLFGACCGWPWKRQVASRHIHFYRGLFPEFRN